MFKKPTPLAVSGPEYLTIRDAATSGHCLLYTPVESACCSAKITSSILTLPPVPGESGS
jgi:hypothetical protein